MSSAQPSGSPPGAGRVAVRPRRAGDLPALGEALLAQQPRSRYPFRNPLPVPTERFLHGHDADAAWTAELGGRPVGHVCRTGPAQGSPDADEVNAAAAAAHGCGPDRLAWVRSLFVAEQARGLGVGRRLLDVVVADLRAHDLRPCLEVLPVHEAAVEMYAAAGWREVHRTRPAWLRDAAGSEGLEVRVLVLDGS
ncbi:GNAT family N-acetyltransferase [Nocardioides solisilvae]|uniref:GNAT family N-acetyltransferase n=1 Tax=Nocardioides solisilvae TaxID=1542435 RepID=UPI000D750372|nr:GNAT family N-acetyltransferase [Nocardioides solisilvae]